MLIAAVVQDVSRGHAAKKIIHYKTLFGRPQQQKSNQTSGVGFLCIRPMPMGKRSITEKIEFQRYPPKKIERASYGNVYTNKKKSSKLLEKPQKTIWGQCWTKIGLRRTQADVWVEAARFRVLDRH